MFQYRTHIIIAAISASFLLSSCSEYQKVLKTEDLDYKYEMAMKYFEKEDFSRAEPLFEELTSVWRGTPKSAEVYFNYAYCLYGEAQFLLAAYHFKNFTRSFPNHEKREYASFLNAYCYYNDSPVYSLDQTSTFKAIDELQLFANQFPNSEYLSKVNELMEDLRGKLERKAFENAKLYLDIEDYEAAILAFDNALYDYPDIRYKEQILYLQLKAHLKLAQKSVLDKQQLRLKEAMAACQEYLTAYPKGKYTNDAKGIEKDLNKLKEQLSNS